VTLAQLVNRFETVERSIVVVNRTDPDPVHDMLADTFGENAVRIVDHRPVGDGGPGTAPADDWVSARPPDGPGADDVEYTIDVAALHRNDSVPFDGTQPSDIENLVLLIEDGKVVAGSTLEELTEAVLFVNSDLYITGTRGLDELELPGVITGLDDTLFTLRGYPDSNRQKLLLITISRFIERVAWTAEAGTIRSSFQRLSRINDELGTRRVYERVADAGVDAHLYGVPETRRATWTRRSTAADPLISPIAGSSCSSRRADRVARLPKTGGLLETSPPEVPRRRRTTWNAESRAVSDSSRSRSNPGYGGASGRSIRTGSGR